MTRAHTPPRGSLLEGRFVGTRMAAVGLGVTERTVLRWCDDGTLPVAWKTPGGHRRIREADVTALREKLADQADAS